MIDRVKPHVLKTNWSDDTYDFQFVVHKPGAEVGMAPWIAEPLVFTEQPEGCMFPVEPALRMHREDVQRMFDDLYHAGFRPSRSVDGEGQHLADMRKIVSKTIGVDL